MLVESPFATYQVERPEAQHDGFLEARQEHTHESDAGKVVDASLLPLILCQGNTELIPVDILGLTITQFHAAGTHVGNETVGRWCPVTVGIENLGRDTHMVLVVTFILVEGIVLVNVFHIRAALIAGIVGFRLLVCIGRVTLRVVDALIAVEDTFPLFVEVTATEVVVVVTGRVVLPGLADAVVDNKPTHGVEPVTIGAICLFFLIIQAIESHILQPARTRGGGKGIGLGGLHGNLTPLGCGKRLAPVDGHATLIEFLTIVEDVLRHLAKVEVEVATILTGRTFLTGVDEGIKQPELDILDVGLFKVIGVETSHHTTPLRLGLLQLSVRSNVTSQVIGSALLGIVGKVEHVERSRSTIIGGLAAVGIELFHIDLTHIVVRQLFEVALDVRGCERGVTAGENRVNAIPGQQGSVSATAYARLIATLREHRGYTREGPLLRLLHTEVGLRIFEIVDIRGIVLSATCRTAYQLGKFSSKGNAARLLHVEEGYLVEHRSEPLTLLFPVYAQAPECVAQRLRTHRHLRGEGLLVEVHQRTANLEAFREVVLPVHAHHRLSLHTVLRVRLQRHTHVGPGVDDALVEDGHLTGRIVYGIVRALGQFHTTRRHLH